METIWKLYKACTLPMITYGSEAWIMNNQEKKQIQSINNKNLRTILSTPDTTPGIALRTETTLADITQEIDIKQINYLLKQLNRGTNEHISNSIWEKKISTVCPHHNIDINVVVVVVDPLLPDYWGESASVVLWGFAASFSRQSSSRAATPEGSLHKSRADSVVGICGQLKRCCVVCS